MTPMMTIDEAKAAHLDDFVPFTYASASGSMPFRLHLPRILSPGRRYPLVVAMHGAGGLGSDNQAQLACACLFAAHPRAHLGDYFILAPQCPPEIHWINHGDSWNGNGYTFSPTPTRSMALALDIIDAVIADFPVDTARMAVGGASMGGYATYDILSRRPGMFRAAFPICGCGDTAKTREIAAADLRIYHGALDSTVFVDCSRRMATALKDANASFVYTEFPDACHDAWTPALNDDALYAWLENHLLQ